MFFKSLLLIPCAKKETAQPTAWRNGYYKTYRLIYALPSVRIHSRFRSPEGNWYVVDTYNIPVRKYLDLSAMITKDGKAKFFKRPDLEWYMLPPDTIFNIGVSSSQGDFLVGGLQFEYIEGQQNKPLYLGNKGYRRFMKL